MGDIQLINPVTGRQLRRTDAGLKDDEGHVFPLRKGAYRMVEEDNYTASFGYQWNRFRTTQLDRHQHNGAQSKQRFLTATGWTKEALAGANVLEVGSGAGRFTQVVLQETDARLYSVDYSSAVEANYENNGTHHDRLTLIQASVYELPFAEKQFDKVFCFGVLQHTPDFQRAVRALASMVREGGELVVDFYPIKGWYTKVNAKYLLRPFTKRMPPEKLMGLIERNADRLIGIYQAVDRMGLGTTLKRFLPICDIANTLPPDLDAERRREWVVLDTFDMFSPEFDNPQRVETVRCWFEEVGLRDVWGGFVRIESSNLNPWAVVRGRR